MALTRVKQWSVRESLTSSDLNAEFDNILTYLNGGLTGSALADPFQMQGTLDLNQHPITNPSRVGKIRYVWPGDNVQSKVDELSSVDNGGIALLMPGTHNLGSSTLTVPASVSLVGVSTEIVNITSTASTVISVAGNVLNAANRLAGFNLQTVSANNVGISITSSSGNFNPGLVIAHVEFENGFSGGSFVGISSNTNVSGVDVRYCRFNQCSTGILGASSNNFWYVHNSSFTDAGAGGYNIDFPSVGFCNVFERNYLSHTGGNANIRIRTQTGIAILNNYFLGTATHGIDIATNGVGDSNQNRGGRIYDNSFNGSGTSGINAMGARGMHFNGNYFSSTYSSAAVTFTGGNSSGNFWGVNDADLDTFPSAPLVEFPFRLEIPNSTQGRTNSYGALLPVSSADPAEVGTTFGAKEYGLMWVTDDGLGAEAIRLFNKTGAASGATLT